MSSIPCFEKMSCEEASATLVTPFSPPRCFPQHGEMIRRRSSARSATPLRCNHFHDELCKDILSLQQGVDGLRLLRKNAMLDDAVKSKIEAISVKVSDTKGAIDSLVAATSFTLQHPSCVESAVNRRCEHSGEDDQYVAHAAYGPDYDVVTQMPSVSSSSQHVQMSLTGNRFAPARTKPLAKTVSGQIHESFLPPSSEGRQPIAAFPPRRKFSRSDASATDAGEERGGAVNGSSGACPDTPTTLQQGAFGVESYASPSQSKPS